MSLILTIGKPYLKRYRNEAGSECTSLCADIAVKQTGFHKTLFYAVSSEYESGLCTELADPFVAAVLPYCMINSIDIETETPVSRRILYELNHRLIPELAKKTERYHRIQIHAESGDFRADTGRSVGLGWSGGVDCMYSLIMNEGVDAESYKITHLVNINAGVYEGTEEETKQKFWHQSQENRKTAALLGLGTIDIDTNLHMVFDEMYLSVLPFRLCSAVLALQKFFSVYYRSSAYEITAMSFDEAIADYYGYAVCSSLSNQNVRIIEAGTEVTRLEKLRKISESPLACENLHVCVKHSDHNCMFCGKCVRTIGALYALGTLNSYNKTFDLNTVNENLDRILGDIWYNRKSHHYRETVELMQKRGMEFSDKALRYAKIMNLATIGARKNKEKLL